MDLIPFTANEMHNLIKLMCARFIAVVSFAGLNLSVAWQVYETTRRPQDLGFVGLMQFIPLLLLAPFAGDMLDRHERKKIYVAALVLTAIFSGMFSLLGSVLEIHWVFIGLVILGAGRAFAFPAQQSLMPTLVREEVFPRAVGISTLVTQIAAVTGPALAGFYLHAFGAQTFYIFNAFMMLMAAGLIQAITGNTAAVKLNSESMWLRLVEGFQFLKKERTVLGAMSLDLFAVLLGGAVALLPIYAKEIYHTDARGLGILRGADAFGAVVVGVWLMRKPLGKNLGKPMLIAVAIFGMATVVFGLSQRFSVGMIALVVIGGADMFSMYIRHTLVQMNTPGYMRGRISAINTVFISASNELGEFESGLTAEAFGTVHAVIMGGMGTLVIVVLWALWFPELRHAHRKG